MNGKSFYQAAHIVPTGTFRWLLDAEKVRLTEIQKLLRDNELMNAAENGFWATPGHLGTHTRKYMDDPLKAFDGVNDPAVAKITLDALRKNIMNGKYV